MWRLVNLAGLSLRSVLGGGTVPVALVAVVLAVFAIGYTRGGNQAQTQCQTATLAQQVKDQDAELVALKAQIAAAQHSRENAQHRARDDAVNLTQITERADVYKQQISGRLDRCILSNDDADGLLGIGQ